MACGGGGICLFVTLVMVGLGNILYWVAPAEYGTAVIGPAVVRQSIIKPDLTFFYRAYSRLYCTYDITRH